MKIRWYVPLAVIVMVVFFVSPAYAVPFTFNNITNNSPTNAAIGEAQLWVDVTGSGSNVTFTFHNTGSESCSITDIYFDYGQLLGATMSIDATHSSSGVSFSPGAAPSDLPGGELWFQADYSADSDSPVQRNGVNPNEYLTINFTFSNGKLFDDVIADLNSSALVTGIHVQGFADGGSESFTTASPAPVPEPATMVLLGSGLIGLGGFRKRIRK